MRKIAIVHDWLVTYAGAERALAEILALCPAADLYAVVDFLPQRDRSILAGREPRTTWLQQLPGVRRHYRSLLPLMPQAIERFDLSGYDLVISSSHAVAKGVRTEPDQPHLCYCYSPMRYAWDMREEYLREVGLDSGILGWGSRQLLERLRRWDERNSQRVTHFVAISRFIAERIGQCYGRDATVVYPPVDTDYYTPAGDKADFYLTASRLVPYKRIQLIVQAFARMPSRKLMVIGEGPQYETIRAVAGKNVEFLGFQPNEVLRDYLRRAKAFVFAAKEDFGILPLEAQACGTPVIAYGAGGSLETVKGWGNGAADRPTGVFFAQQEEQSLIAAVERFEANQDEFRASFCREHALNFTVERFRQKFWAQVEPWI